MTGGLRKTGIAIVGDVPWGTHFCQFYATKEDLIDILVPYFKAGLENNEACMWVTSGPLSVQEAKQALAQAVPDLEARIDRHQIEVVPYTEWYLKDGYFDLDRVLNGWVAKLNQALARGYSGLRVTGNTAWLEKKDWQSFVDYEAAINRVIGSYEMMALCTYSLGKCGATEIIDVVRNHEFALVKQEGKWELFESAIYKQTKEALRESEEKYRNLFSAMSDGFALHEIILDNSGRPADYRFLEVNEAFSKQTGLSADSVLGKTVREAIPSIEPYWIETYGRVALTGEPVLFENYSQPLGRWYEVYAYCTEKGRFATLFRDITERKQTEAALARAKDELEIKVAERTTKLEEVTNDLRREIAERKEAEWSIQLSNALMRLFWQTTSRKAYLDAAVNMLRDWSGCRHVGIRALDEQGNIPYMSYVGFTREFIESESMLSLKKDQCACIRVIAGKPDPQDLSAMTPAGSFWCDNTVKFVGGLTKGEQSRYRGVCIRSGFKSVAVVPIRHAGKALGAIHLADEREAALPQKVINVIESLAVLIGEGIYRFHVEELLQRSQDSLARAQHIAHLGNWDWDITKNELLWSDEVYRIFGLAPQQFEATYEAFLGYVHPDDREYVSQSVNRAFYEGKPYSIDHRIVRPDGSERTVHEEAEVTFDQAGKPVRMVGTVHDITRLKRAEEDLRALSRRLVEIQENERRAIARELHDQIGQSMTVLRLMLDKAMHSPAEGVRPLLSEAQTVATEVMAQVRNLSLSLRPSMLDHLGLLPTLLWHFDRYSAQTQVQVDFKHAGLNRRFRPEVATAAFRIAQEALTNVVRHASVKEAMVRAWADRKALHIQIEDRGDGFDRAALPPGTSSGLSVMHERALSLGGKLTVEAAPGAGTRVIAELPLSGGRKRKRDKNDKHSASG